MSAYWKDIVREILSTKGRFLSLLVIAALGASSIVGIQATSIDMRSVADKLYKERSLYDVQIKSTMGFDNDDILAVANAQGVKTVMPSYLFDIYAYIGDETHTVRAYSLPDEQSLNQIELVTGRLPKNESECAVEQRFLDAGRYSIGDTIALGLDDMSDYYDVFEHSELTITGTVKSPLYINLHDRGLTTLGSGRLDFYIYMHPSAFLLDVYTDLYVQMSESVNMDQLSDGYGEASDRWVTDIKYAGNERVRYWENEIADARRELADGYMEYYDGLAELEEKVADGWRELDDAALELEEAKIELENGQQELDDEIASAIAEVNRQERALIDAQNELDTQSERLSAGRSAISAARTELEINLAELEENLAGLELLGPEGVSPELDAMYAQIHHGISMIQEGFAEIEGRQRTLNSSRAQIESAQAEIDSGHAEIARARRRIEAERIEAQQEIDDGWEAYYEGLAEYEDGVLTLETEEADARLELEDAWDELQDAEEELSKVPEPEWFYFTRIKDGVAFDSYYQDTLRLEQIGFVFPLVFFLVAVMVTLTTMTRMVEEHRTQIGVYKALGFGTGRVMTKYLLYAFIAGALGGALGVTGGSYVFPIIITDAYGYLYDMPPVETPIPLFIGTLAIAASVGSVALVTFFTCIKAASHEPSVLMRPKPPRSGKRVMIERIPILWNRLSFIAKVTARNIFRYKTRFFMTLVGVAGCAALLVTAFGLRDSIGSVSIEQFGRIAEYDARLYTKDITDENERRQLDESLTESRSLYVHEESVLESGEKLDVSLVVPEDFDELKNFINFFAPQTKEAFEPDGSGVIITEKLAEQTDTGVGDYMTITLDGEDFNVSVEGVAENYILNFMYMPPEMYREIFGKSAAFNGALIISETPDELGRELLAVDNVRAYIVTEDHMESIADSTDALGIVTVVLIVLACALALVVLFNLTNINITERIRELATIKVLGFNNAELALYIYRENLVVTTMGIALGTWAGLFLHGFILKTVEVDMLMFPRIIHASSYIWAAALSAIFAILVNIIMNFRLSSIDMVGSLKNVE